MLNSVPGFEEDLNRLIEWTSCTPLMKPRPRAWAWRGVAWRGAVRPAGRAVRGAAGRDVTCRYGAVRLDVLR